MRFAKFFEVIAKLINYGLFSFKYEQIKFANEYILSAEHIASTKFCIICILSAVILFLAVISGHLSVLNFFFARDCITNFGLLIYSVAAQWLIFFLNFCALGAIGKRTQFTKK